MDIKVDREWTQKFMAMETSLLVSTSIKRVCFLFCEIDRLRPRPRNFSHPLNKAHPQSKQNHTPWQGKVHSGENYALTLPSAGPRPPVSSSAARGAPIARGTLSRAGGRRGATGCTPVPRHPIRARGREPIGRGGRGIRDGGEGKF